MTGLPFVYAFWAAGRARSTPATSQRCSRRATRAWRQSDEIARAYFPDDAGPAGGRRRATCGIISSTISAPRSARACELFYRYAAEAGVVRRALGRACGSY